MDPLLSVKEAAKRLGISRATLYRLFKLPSPTGLRPVHVGRRCLVAESELRRFVAGLLAKTEEDGRHSSEQEHPGLRR